MVTPVSETEAVRAGCIAFRGANAATEYCEVCP